MAKAKPRAIPRGMGSVFARESDGRWVVRLNLGGGRYRTRYAPTEADALALFWQLRGQLDVLAAGGDRLTLAQWLEQWFAELVRPHRAPRTARFYRAILDHHLIPELGGRKLGQLSVADVDRFTAARLADHSAAYVAGMRTVLRAALADAERRDLVQKNVAARSAAIRSEPRESPEVSPERALALLQALSGHRHGNLFAVILATGMRHSEALGLARADVDAARETVRVRRQLYTRGGDYELAPLKARARAKLIPLLPFAVEALARERALQAERRLRAPAWEDRLGLVFTGDRGRPLHMSTTGQAWVALVRASGLEGLRVHDLRHACASLLAAAGAPPRVVADWLGHSDVSITLNVYTHALPAGAREAAARLAGLLQGPAEGPLDGGGPTSAAAS
jgi:integrase